MRFAILLPRSLHLNSLKEMMGGVFICPSEDTELHHLVIFHFDDLENDIFDTNAKEQCQSCLCAHSILLQKNVWPLLFHDYNRNTIYMKNSTNKLLSI